MVSFTALQASAASLDQSNLITPQQFLGCANSNYPKIINKSNEEIKLTSIEANIAKTQEIHEVILENDVYKMRPINTEILIKSQETLEFKPKSHHFMFFNFNKKLEDNEFFFDYKKKSIKPKRKMGHLTRIIK